MMVSGKQQLVPTHKYCSLTYKFIFEKKPNVSNIVYISQIQDRFMEKLMYHSESIYAFSLFMYLDLRCNYSKLYVNSQWSQKMTQKEPEQLSLPILYIPTTV